MSQPLTPQEVAANMAYRQVTEYATSLSDHFAQLFPGLSLHFTVTVDVRVQAPLAPVTAQEAQEAASTSETPLDTSTDTTQES